MTKSRNLAKFPKTSAIQVPSGDTASRPSAANGYFRYNTTTASFEGYSNGNWGAVGGAMYVSANTVSDANNISTGYFALPVGTTAQRPVNTANGYIRYNTTTTLFEGFSNGSWGPVTNPPYIGSNTVSDIFNTSNGAFYVPTGNNAQRPVSPQNGALRYNTANNAFEGYANNAWGSIGGTTSSGGTSALTTYKYVATQGQTTFSGLDANSLSLTYTVGALIVTLNGLTLKNGTDYTATNGSSIVLTVAADLNDEINIYAFTTTALVTANNTLSVYKFVSTSGQTTYTGADSTGSTLAYTRNAIFVTLNGSVLKDVADFVQTDSSTLTLTAGATANDELNIYTFNPVSIGSTATLTTYKYTANASQTLFAGLDSQGYALSYNPGAIFVALNGAILTDTIDYTATSGNTITLILPAAANDELIINSFGVFNIANTYTKTEANASFILKAGDTITGNINMTSNGYFQVPIGTTAQRPAAATQGYIRYNTTLNSLESANGTAWSNVGSGSASSGGVSWQPVQNTNFVAVKNNGYLVNTATGNVTVTLPASPTFGDTITVVDYGGVATSNAIIFNPNGNKILSNTSNVYAQSSSESIGLVYTDTNKGWIPYYGFTSPPIGIYPINALIVAGGAGGGSQRGGGGGAGGLIYQSSVNVIPGTSYAVSIGSGGTGGAAPGGNIGANGGNSSVFGLTAIGGGGGGGDSAAPIANGQPGGSGGGAANYSPVSAGSGTAGQGNAGGGAVSYSGNYGAGGGGGAGSAGGQGNGSVSPGGGNGGVGISSSISGTNVYYAGGGGGGSYNASSTGGSGGNGGGGNSGSYSGNGPGASGSSNTGGGGGGGTNGSGYAYSGGNGGSGIVIISYLGPQRASGGTISSSGGYTIHTFNSSGTFIA